MKRYCGSPVATGDGGVCVKTRPRKRVNVCEGCDARWWRCVRVMCGDEQRYISEYCGTCVSPDVKGVLDIN